MPHEIDEIPDGYEEVTEDGGRKYLKKKAVIPPKTTTLVGDDRAKQIRGLEEKISRMEKTGQDTSTELNSLRELVRKLGEVPAPIPTPAGKKPESLLSWLNDLCFGPEKNGEEK